MAVVLYKALGLIQPVTEMNTRNLPSVKRMELKADNLTAIC
jgi:hypothetical protein